jgi:hypothetical protein
MTMNRLIRNNSVLIAIMSLVPLLGFSQVSPENIKEAASDSVVVLEESDDVIINSLVKGRVTVGIGGRFKTDLDKNFDSYSQYVLEQKDKDFFLQLNASYFVKDRQSLGIFGRYADFDSNYAYITVLGDTVRNKTSESSFRGGFFYKMHTPVFGSQRVYWITIAELGIGSGTRTDNTIVKETQNLAKTDFFSTSFVLRFGFLVFPFKNFSIEGSLAAVGAGYEKQEFFLDGQEDGSSEDFFVLLTPDLFTIQFKIATYF